MEYEATSELASIFLKVRNKLIYNFGFATLIILIYVYPLYNGSGGRVNFLFIGILALTIVLVGLLDRSRTLAVAKPISNTAISVSIFEDYLIVKTPSIKVLFWINEPAKELRFSMRDFTRNKVAYPTKLVYDLDNDVWKLVENEKVVYIITDYFDIDFKIALEKFLYWK